MRSLWCVNLANIVDFRPMPAGIWLFPGPFPVCGRSYPAV
jgi:hypothetical protein